MPPGETSTGSAIRPRAAPRRLARFALTVAALYGLAMFLYAPFAGWPGLGRFHAHILAATGELVYAGGDADRSVHFVVLSPPPPDGGDLVMSVRQWRAYNSSRMIGYGPLALAVALTLATPIPWRRRLLALAATLVLMHVLLTMRMGAQLWYGLHGPGSPEEQATGVSASIATEELGMAINSPSIAYGTAVIVWLVAAIRSRDLAWLVPAADSPASRLSSSGIL